MTKYKHGVVSIHTLNFLTCWSTKNLSAKSKSIQYMEIEKHYLAHFFRTNIVQSAEQPSTFIISTS